MEKQKVGALLGVALLFVMVLYNTRSSQPTFIKGTNVPANHLVSTSSTYPRAYWAKPEPDYTWKLLKDLGINILQVGGGQEGNVLHIQANENHPWGRSYNPDWAENLEAFLAKADFYGMKVIFHTMGGRYGCGLGIVAPMHNYKRIEPYSSIENAFAVIDKLGGQNSLGKNFLKDPRISWWCPINEARLDYNDVKEWTVAVLQRISMYGGKTSVCVNDGAHHYYETFPYIIPIIGDYVDYLQAHCYNHPTLAAVCEQGPDADVYQPMYDVFSMNFKTMMSTKGKFEADEVFLTECGCGNGNWTGVLAPGYYGGTPLSTTKHQQADYIRAYLDAAKDNGVTITFYHETVDIRTDINYGFGFIDYYGNIDEEPYNAFKDA